MTAQEMSDKLCRHEQCSDCGRALEVETEDLVRYVSIVMREAYGIPIKCTECWINSYERTTNN